MIPGGPRHAAAASPGNPAGRRQERPWLPPTNVLLASLRAQLSPRLPGSGGSCSQGEGAPLPWVPPAVVGAGVRGWEPPLGPRRPSTRMRLQWIPLLSWDSLCVLSLDVHRPQEMLGCGGRGNKGTTFPKVQASTVTKTLDICTDTFLFSCFFLFLVLVSLGGRGKRIN